MKSDISSSMRLLLGFLVLLMGSNLLADDAEGPTKEPLREMRLLTVGEMPPFRQEIRDGVRYQLPAPPGSLPPTEVDVRIPSADGKEKKGESIRLRIGNISAPVKVPAGKGALVMRVAESASEGKPWLRLERPESGDFIVVMWRGQRNNSWDEPSAFVMPTNLGEGQASLINVAPGNIAVVYGGERLALRPLSPLTRPLDPGRPLGLQVGLAKADTLQRLISRSIEQPPGHSSIVVFFRNDGEKPRSPLGVKVIRVKAN